MVSHRNCGLLIKQIHDSLEKKSNNALRSQDLTMAQVGVLFELNAKDSKQMQLKELEHVMHVAQSTAAGIVLRLEQKGFVESFGSEEDRRIKIVRITQAGLQCCRQARESMDETEELLLKGLNENERKELLVLLEHVFENLK